MTLRQRRARVRAEYVWPYPNVQPDAWYPIKSKPSDEDGWLWIETRPMPTYARAEHFEFVEVEADVAAGASGELRSRVSEEAPLERQARLKPSAQRTYGRLIPGVWMWAREIVEIIRTSARATPGERRRRRLSEQDFEFRDVDTAPVPQSQFPSAEQDA